MAAQDAAATVMPVRMSLLFSAPLVMKRGEETAPITLLPVQREIEALADACRDLGVALEIETAIATTERIGYLFATARQPFDVLHFSGHGSRHLDGASVLALEDETGIVRDLDAVELRRLIGSQPCRLAFLSACHSAGLAEALLAAGVRHVVAINAADPVIDLAARVFAVRFYAALFAGRSVAEAFAAGCTAVATNDELRQWRDPETLQTLNVREEVKFRLLPENDPVHQQPLAPALPCGQLTFRRPQWQNTNLSPVAADPFVGRARELHAIAQALRDNRCVAIHGMGGMGKTALAEAAARWQHERNRWRDGVWLVGLRNITTASEARSRIAFAIGLAPETAESDATLAGALADRQSLLVLDDLDALLIHDRQGLVGMVRALLGTRFLKLLTTARLDLPGRIHYASLELTRLTTEDALTAFLTYAPPIEKWGKWTPDEWRDLLRFLDGYPFPIRLTATAMRVARLSLRDLWRRLQANPQGTLRYPGDEEDRETSLAATLDLSYNVLPAAAQRVFALLALFPAGLTRNAAQAIADIEAETLETVVHYGMAEWRGTADYAQCALPEPARRYAEARLAQQMPDALATYAPAALAYFAGLIEAADEAIIKGNERSGITILTLEQPNLERYLDWGYEQDTGNSGINWAARATARLRNYWTLTGERGRLEVLARLKRALDSARRSSDTTGEANVRKAIGDVQRFRKEMDAALTSYHEALTLYRALGARLGEANVRKAIGDVQQFRDDRDAALTSYHEALTLYRALGDRLGEANVLQAIGDVQQFRDDRDAALTSYHEALTLYRALGARLGEANVLQAIGDVQQFRDDRDAALTSYHEALTLYRALGDRLGEANVLQAIGDVQQFRKEMDAALTSYHEALTLYRALGARLGEANVLQAIGDVQQFRDDRDAALTSYHEALTLYRALGDRLGEANVLQAIGDVQQFRKEMDAALTSYHEALTLYRALGARLGEANVRKAIGDVQQFRDDRDAALTSYHEALTLYRALGDRLGEANVLQAIGDVQQLRKEMDAALTSYHEALTLYRALGARLGEANVLQAIGDVQQFRKEMDAALTSYHEALTLYRALGARLGEANVLQAIGDVQQFRKEMDAALTSYHEALTLYRALGARLGEANVRKAIGDVQQFRDDRDAALTSYHEALTLYRALGARLGEANVRKAIGDVQQFRDDRDAALTSYHEALTLYRALGARLGEANVLQAIGDVQQFRKEMDAALTSYHEALTLYRALGARLGEANVLQAIGDVQQFRKEMDAALTSYHEALTLYRALGARLGEANVLQAIGDVQQFRDDRDAALTSYHEALTLYRALGDRLGEANVLQAIGDVQQFRKEMDAALTSYHEALTLYRALGARLGEANVLAALSRLRLDDDPAASQQLLEQALVLRRAINDRYSEGADLGNYGIALLQRGRGAEALPYLQRARAVFADLGMAHLVAQMDQLIALASGDGG